MIKFFRKIRQNLIMENKTTKYFKYAIGEIVLVVIGILIAVGINSLYNTSQNEAKIKTILTQVQQDLKTDILDAKRIFNVYIAKDSLFQKIMNDSITFKMYKANPYSLPINGNYVSFSNKKGGYNRFINNLENLPDKYNGLLPYFNNLYFEIQNEIDDYNTFIKNTVMIDSREDLKTNPKITDYRAGKYPDEALEFYFKDPFLKNKSSKYMNDLKNIAQAANAYRIESITLYKMIDSLLGKTPSVYKEPIDIRPNKQIINAFLGDYKEIKDESVMMMSISIENEQVILKSSNNPDANLYWHKDDYYFIKENGPIFMLHKNEQDQHVIKVHFSGQEYTYIKIKDL
jgi:hypothetical protein